MGVTWPGTPSFLTGQVVSAAAHLNALSDAVQWLLDARLGHSVCCNGRGDVHGPGQVWHGFCRHKTNRLRFRYVLHNGGGQMNAYVNGFLVLSYTSGDLVQRDETVDITGIGLAPNQFYEISIQHNGVGRITVLAVAETRLSTELPALASFADGTTPTAADWNNLSAYIEAVKNRILTPRPVQPPSTQSAGADWATAGVATGRYLLYRIHASPPFYNPNGDPRELVRIYVGTSWSTLVQVKLLEARHEVVWEATLTNGLAIDLFEYGWYVGQDLIIRTSTEDHGDPGGEWVRVHYFHYQPEASAALPGWAKLPRWEHGMYVLGNQPVPPYIPPGVSFKALERLRADLVLLKDRSWCYNYAGRVSEPGEEGLTYTMHPIIGWYAKRTHRYLHYTNADGLSPKLYYYHDEKNDDGSPKESEVSLPNAYIGGQVHFQAYDLSSIDGLWPGLNYRLVDVLCAIEDVEG